MAIINNYTNFVKNFGVELCKQGTLIPRYTEKYFRNHIRNYFGWILYQFRDNAGDEVYNQVIIQVTKCIEKT